MHAFQRVKGAGKLQFVVSYTQTGEVGLAVCLRQRRVRSTWAPKPAVATGKVLDSNLAVCYASAQARSCSRFERARYGPRRLTSKILIASIIAVDR